MPKPSRELYTPSKYTQRMITEHKHYKPITVECTGTVIHAALPISKGFFREKLSHDERLEMLTHLDHIIANSCREGEFIRRAKEAKTNLITAINSIYGHPTAKPEHDRRTNTMPGQYPESLPDSGPTNDKQNKPMIGTYTEPTIAPSAPGLSESSRRVVMYTPHATTTSRSSDGMQPPRRFSDTGGPRLVNDVHVNKTSAYPAMPLISAQSSGAMYAPSEQTIPPSTSGLSSCNYQPPYASSEVSDSRCPTGTKTPGLPVHEITPPSKTSSLTEEKARKKELEAMDAQLSAIQHLVKDIPDSDNVIHAIFDAWSTLDEARKDAQLSLDFMRLRMRLVEQMYQNALEAAATAAAQNTAGKSKTVSFQTDKEDHGQNPSRSPRLFSDPEWKVNEEAILSLDMRLHHLDGLIEDNNLASTSPHMLRAIRLARDAIFDARTTRAPSITDATSKTEIAEKLVEAAISEAMIRPSQSSLRTGSYSRPVEVVYNEENPYRHAHRGHHRSSTSERYCLDEEHSYPPQNARRYPDFRDPRTQSHSQRYYDRYGFEWI